MSTINYGELVPVPAAGSFNTGLSYCRSSTMISLLGHPRASYTDKCADVTNASIRKRLVVGTFLGKKFTGLDVAIESLKRAEAAILHDHPDIGQFFRSAGMLCCRRIRGSRRTPSNHSWGTAFDHEFKDTVTGKWVLAPLGSPVTCRGTLILRPYLYKEGWFWGAGFSRKDSMHFEVADETVRKWL